MALSGISVNAEMNYQYGALVKSATMEGSTATYLTNHNNGSFKIGRTTDVAHTGQYSYYIDTKTATAELKQYTQQFQASTSDIKNNRLLFEGYVKKDNNTETHASIWYYNTNGLVKTGGLNKDEPDENGWVRNWVIVNTNDYDSTSLSMNFGYTYKADDGLTKIYYDDHSARLLPMGIYANDLSSKTSVISLDKIDVTGYDAIGNPSKIKTTDLFENTVVSGRAYIDDNNNLVYTGKTGGVVTVKCKFFDLEDTFDVKFDLPVYVGEITEADGVYSVIVDNGLNYEISATLCVAVYDGDRLALVNTCPTTINSFDTKTIICEKPEIPYYVNNPIIKTYLLK